jgi:hypothetical protein
MRHLNIRAASLTSGSDAAIIDAIAHIGLVSTILSSVYQRIAEAIKTLTANRIPTESRWLPFFPLQQRHVLGQALMGATARSIAGSLQ